MTSQCSFEKSAEATAAVLGAVQTKIYGLLSKIH